MREQDILILELIYNIVLFAKEYARVLTVLFMIVA